MPGGYGKIKSNEGKPFKKGQSGNPNGRPKMPDLKEAIAEVIGDEGVREILQAVRARAKKGDTKAADLILDRFYGKAKGELDINMPDTININLKRGGN